jgi:hypothetical protein
VTAQIDQEERPVVGAASPSPVVAQMILHRNVISLSATAAGARIGSLLLIPALYKRGLQASIAGAKAAELKPHRAPADQVVEGWCGRCACAPHPLSRSPMVTHKTKSPTRRRG